MLPMDSFLEDHPVLLRHLVQMGDTRGAGVRQRKEAGIAGVFGGALLGGCARRQLE